VRPGIVQLRVLPSGVVHDLVASPATWAVYEVIADPPSDAGGVHDTVAWVLPAVAVTPVGVPGAVAAGVTAEDAVDALDVPALFVAFTVNV
jgi:hypothetical protein